MVIGIVPCILNSGLSVVVNGKVLFITGLSYLLA